jgi:hypothetical protein
MSKVNVVSAEISPQLRLQLVASQPITDGEVVVQSCEEEVQDQRTWRTLQLSENRHLRNEFLIFIDHSCSPNSLLDTDRLALVAIRDIPIGSPITFFYPGSEVELSQPFGCHCGSNECMRHINGGFYLTHDRMQWAISKGYCTKFMRQQFERLLGDSFEERPH